MSAVTPELIDVETDDGSLGTIRWRGAPGTPVVFALPGHFGNAWVWSSVARELDGRAGLVAIDLRGRGTSSSAPGPFGVHRHASDLFHVVRRFNAAPAIAVGHSLGAVVALAVATDRPEIVDGVVLVEGGPPVIVRDDVPPETQVEELIRPYAELVKTVWPDRVSYEAAWNEIPILRDLLTPEVERYLLSDLVECDGGYRSRTNLEAVRRDLLDLFVDDDIRTLLDRRATRTPIVRAGSGLTGTPPPVYDDTVTNRYHWHDWRTVDDRNYFSILMEGGAREVTRAILDEIEAVRHRR